MSFFDELWTTFKEQLSLSPGPALTPQQRRQGPNTQDALGMAVPNPTGTDTSKILQSSANAVQSAGDFFSWIAWIFHPLNWLRAVEFLTGLLLFWMALRPYLDRSGRSLGGTGATRVIRSTLASTPAGRMQRQRQGRRMGTYEGQRESARMEARQRVTRPQREASARERVQIQRNARRSQ